MDAPEQGQKHGPVRDVVNYELLFDCVHCGLCLEACPTYILTRTEMDSPRGRIYQMKALAEGTLDADADVVHHLDFCLGCRGCETACPSGVHYGALIEQTRAWIEGNYRRSLADRLRRWIIGELFPYPARLRIALAPLKLIERAGLRPLLERAMPRSLREWIELLPPLTVNGAADQTGTLSPTLSHREMGVGAGKAIAVDGERGSVLVHRGCVAQVLADSANRNADKLLDGAGYRMVRLAHTVCCGALDLHSGNRKRALEFARANVRAIKNSGAEFVISTASGCSTAMAEYGELLKDDPELAATAREVSAQVKELSGLLLQGDQPFHGRMECMATYHDACHLAHGLGIREAPRALLRSILGVKLVEMESSDLCCGSAGSYNLTHPQAARELAQCKADTIMATGADYVVLANPGCQFQIAAELHRRGSAIKVMHLADFVALAASDSRK
jgi:glycolate oxidase iron-sulfur subunit